MPTIPRPTVLITGATSDIGSAITREYARNGWDILMWYNSANDKASDLIQTVGEAGATCDAMQVDFYNPAKVEKAVARIRTLPIAALVCNAGGWSTPKRFSNLSFSEVTDALSLNFTAHFLLAGAVFEKMLSKGFGRIVGISSVAAKYGGSTLSMQYGCAKRALEGIVKTLAREGAEKNVLANSVRFGVVDTDFHTRMERDMRARIDLIPMKRMGTPEEMAKAVYTLGSGENTFITGQTIAVTGGE